MTVKDLIAELQTRDQDAVVYRPCGETEAREVMTVSPNEEWTDTIRGRKYAAVVLDREALR